MSRGQANSLAQDTRALPGQQRCAENMINGCLFTRQNGLAALTDFLRKLARLRLLDFAEAESKRTFETDNLDFGLAVLGYRPNGSNLREPSGLKGGLKGGLTSGLNRRTV